MAMWPHGTCQRLREKNTMFLGHFSRIPAVYWSFRKGSQLALSCDPCDWSLWIFCSVAASMTEVKLEIDMALSENWVPHSIGWLIIILPTKSNFVGIPINSQTHVVLVKDPMRAHQIPWSPYCSCINQHKSRSFLHIFDLLAKQCQATIHHSPPPHRQPHLAPRNKCSRLGFNKSLDQSPGALLNILVMNITYDNVYLYIYNYIYIYIYIMLI